MAVVSVAEPTEELDALGLTITQNPMVVDDAWLWLLRQAAATAGVVLIVVGDPSPPGPGGGPDGLDEAEVDALIDARLAAFSEVCD